MHLYSAIPYTDLGYVEADLDYVEAGLGYVEADLGYVEAGGQQIPIGSTLIFFLEMIC